MMSDIASVLAYTSLQTELHAPVYPAIMVSLDAPLVVRTRRPQGTWVTAVGRAIAFPPHSPRQVHAPGPCLLLSFDHFQVPQADALTGGKAASHLREPAVLGGALGRWIEQAVHSQRAALNKGDILHGLAQEVASRLPPATPPLVDPRVSQVIETFRYFARMSNPEIDIPAPRLERAVIKRTAGAGGITASHLRALFVRDTGAQLRQYLLWQRLLTAVAASALMDLTSAAAYAGFSDLPHFSRTARRMAGGSPSRMAARLLR